MAERGQPMGRHRVRTLMQRHGLRPVWRRKFVHTSDSKHGLAVGPNLLNCAGLSLSLIATKPLFRDITVNRLRRSVLISMPTLIGDIE